VLLALVVSGCGAGPAETFDLSALEVAHPHRAPRGQLIIAEPVASAPLDGDRILVRPSSDAVATLRGAQWRERLPRLVQTRLVQSFENGKYLKAVGRSDSRLASDFSLMTELRRFEVDVVSGEAVVEIAAKLVHESSGRIRAAQIFTARIPSTADSASAVPSLDAALREVMDEMILWVSLKM
jgi:cholesterol transport system auxiliary component